LKILNLNQGSQEWLAARKSSFNASEASAMMGDSKHMSRNDLLQQKKTGVSKPINAATQRIFDLGHKYEDNARLIVSMEQCEELPPLVGSLETCGLNLLASFDGLTDTYCWEHKSWNKTLAENVSNCVLEPHYYWQLEQQCLVAGVNECLFTVSDGTEENMISMWYTSIPSRQEQLIAGWLQFDKDLESFEVAAKVEVLIPADYTSLLPSVSCKVQGTELVTNIGDCLIAIKDLAEDEMSKKLESDQDFANKESLNKDVKKARAALKTTLANIQGEFVSYSQFAETAAELDSVLQKMQSHGEKQVKQEKEARKQAILNNASNGMTEFLASSANGLSHDVIHNIAMTCQPDFVGVMKGKRTIESLQNAVDDELARCKREISPKLSLAAGNYAFYVANAAGFEFLFPDISNHLDNSTEAFEGIIARRIQTHKEAEEKRLAHEREQMRLEEEAKAKRKAEAEARAKEEAERQRIRAEEREKAQAEVEPPFERVPAVADRKEKPIDVVAKVEECQRKRNEGEANLAVNPYPLQTAWDELAAWCSKYQVSLQASQELEEIIKKHI
jgi:predicted phage-related endonuclease